MPAKTRMKWILISQRRDTIAGRDEARDGLDVRWAKILFDLGFLPIPVCSELAGEGSYLAELKPDGILLSGGNDLGEASKRDQLETQLLDYAKANKLPVLGVCRGMQIFNHYLGGRLVKVTGHVATQHPLEGDWAKQQGYQQVNSYHNQAIIQATLAPILEVLATATDGVIEAVKHSSLPWLGVMWHPERDTNLHPADEKLIANHFNGLKV